MDQRKIVEGVLATVGWPMRDADFQVVMLMWGDHPAGVFSEHHRELSLINVAAEYAWDHILGEPKRPTARQIARYYQKLRKQPSRRAAASRQDSE